MRRLWLIGLALTPLVAAPANAAELGKSAPAQMSWIGCYAGGNFSGLSGVGDTSARDVGALLGNVQSNCNPQNGRAFVFGVQRDFAWSGSRSADLVNSGSFDQSGAHSLASVTGRVGYVWGQFLGYVKAGGAWRDDTNVLAATSETRGGWTGGVGGEMALAKNWSAFVEYNYYNLGSHANAFTGSAGSVLGNADVKENLGVVKGGINYKFEWSR
jgi:outer membrane immunogenic protein